MNSAELKKKMMQLWKETFHDSDAYVSLVFNNYFDPELAEYEESGGDIVAGLLGIPYEFGNADRQVKALYLCGLATKPQYRSRGIMTRLLARINEKAREAGFVFTFLIPEDEGLRKYYHDREYVNAFYRVVDNYTSLHDFDHEYESILLEQKEKVAQLKKRYFDSLKCGVLDVDSVSDLAALDGVKSLLKDIESRQEDLQIIHSERDIDILIRENVIDGGEVHYVCNSDGETTAAAFITFDESVINIRKLYSRDVASKYKVLSSVKRAKPEFGIRHYVPSIEMDRKALWSRTYGSFMSDAPQSAAISVTERVYSLAAHAKMYGMVRILNFPEILKFQAEGRHDLKYSILAKADGNYTFEQIDVRDGHLKIKKLPVDSLSPSQTAHVMSRRDIGEILFRRRDTDNLITEAFGIPSINGSICLMLD